ncbi:hypothetical protein [Streptomyces sp. NPDC101393]|uniref:hypothetical protein n=1 Tax=Streptomyces sp. NPDC101393 TaxID=3366141 RepID=UPI003823BA7E
MNLSPYEELLPLLSGLARILRCPQSDGPAEGEAQELTVRTFAAHERLQATEADVADEAAADMAAIVHAACASMPRARVR